MHPKRILIVEDQILVVFHLKHFLILSGYQVIGHTDIGEKAIEMAKNLKPDLIILDIEINGNMGGIQTLEKLRLFTQTPVLVISSRSDMETMNRVSNSSANGFASKPVNQDELLYKIENIFTNKVPY